MASTKKRRRIRRGKIKAMESPAHVRASICLHTDNSRRHIAPMPAKWRQFVRSCSPVR